jgi:integrase/recombinase XerD
LPPLTDGPEEREIPVAVHRRNDTKTKRWFYKFVIDGVTYKEAIPTARTRRQAEEAETKARDDVHAGRYQPRRRARSVAFDKFAREVYLPWAKEHRKSYADRRAAVEILCKHFGATPLGRLSQITVERFKLDYLRADTARAKPPAPATVNQRLAILSAIMSRAAGLGLVGKNPCRSVEELPLPEAEPRYLTREEQEALMPELLKEGRWAVDVTICLLGTGFRVRELLRLEKADVDFARGLVFVRHPKWAGDPRRTTGVPMSGPVLDVLLRRERESPSRFLFVRPGTGEPISRSLYGHRLKSAGDRAGVEGIHPHSLRHTFGTRLGAADVNLKKIQRLMGHARIEQTMQYQHLDDETLREAAEVALSRPESVPGAAATSEREDRKMLKAVQ